MEDKRLTTPAADAPAPEVSVVVPTRNRRDWLKQCVASVMAQRGVAWELIVVDDASSDGSSAWLAALSDPRVRVIRHDRHGERACARNAGLVLCRGAMVLFLDDDDQLWPGALSELAEALRSHPSAVAVVGARQAWFTTERFKRREPHPRRLLLREIGDELLLGWCPTGGQALLRTARVREADGFDASVVPCEDRDLWHRLASRGPVLFHPRTVVTYRQHPFQSWTPRRLELRERVARRAIRALPRPQRRHGLLLRRSRALLDRAESDLMAGRTLGGIRSALRAVVLTPRIFGSPLVAEWVARWLAGRALRYYLPPPEVHTPASTPVSASSLAGGLAFHPDAPVVPPGVQAHPIVVQRRGGVGNQLFQYAVALQLADQFGASISCTPTDSPLRIRDLQLEDLLGPLPRARWADLARFLLPPAGTPWWAARSNRRLRRWLGIGRPVWAQPGEFVEQIERASIGGGVLLNGYFQSLDWVEGALPELAARLVARRPQGAVPDEGAIAVSFRTGRDFRDAGWTLPLAYYERALAQLDPERSAMLWSIGDERDDLGDIERQLARLGWRTERPEIAARPAALGDFWNLARARRLVLSCSTFAWWAAVAGDHLWGERHVVACPEPWRPEIRRALRRPHWRAVEAS